MFQYFGLLLKGIGSKKYWLDRWDTFLGLLKPGEFYGNVGKKDWDNNAYLLGLTISLLNVGLIFIGLSTVVGLFGSVTGFLSGTGFFLGFALSLFFGLLVWFLGALILYYIVAWIFAYAVKLITKRNDLAKIRPILFSLAPVGLVGVIPIIGSFLSLILTVVLLVIAYEKSLKVERGQAVGGTLLGIVFSGLALVLPVMLLITSIFIGVLSSNKSVSNVMAFSKSMNEQVEKAEKVDMPDSWGPFEFIHYRSGAEKQKDATDILVAILEGDVKSAFKPDIAGSLQNQGYKNLLEKLYPAPYSENVPMDCYRLAIQRLYAEKADLKTKYDTANPYNSFDSVFDNLTVGAYNLGKGPSTITVAEVEQHQQLAKQQAGQQAAQQAKMLQNYQQSLKKLQSAGFLKTTHGKAPAKNTHAAANSANAESGDNGESAGFAADTNATASNTTSNGTAASSAPVPTATSAASSAAAQNSGNDAVGKAAGDAAANVAKNLLHF